MSLLPSTTYANPGTPVWSAVGGGVGAASTVNYIWNNASSPVVPPIQTNATYSPSPAYTFLQARRTEPGPNPTQTFYGRFDSNGNCFLEYAWDGFIYLPMFLRGRPITILGDNSAVVRLTDESTGGTGVLTVDASNNLFWNGTQLN